MKSACLKIERIKLEDLNPHPRNPRHHPEIGSAKWNALKKSLDLDYFDPIVFNRRNGMLVSGHLRAKVLRELGFEMADCVVVDYSEEIHIARMLAANRLIGEDDLPAMKDLLLELDTGALDVDITGYDEGEMERLMTQFQPEENINQEVCEKCGTKLKSNEKEISQNHK